MTYSATDSPVYLTACASCGAYPSATFYVTEVPQTGPFRCPKCKTGEIPADEHAGPGATVKLVDRGDTPWVILTRDGDTLTVRPLGLPSFPARQVCLTEVLPKFSYDRLNARR